MCKNIEISKSCEFGIILLAIIFAVGLWIVSCRYTVYLHEQNSVNVADLSAAKLDDENFGGVNVFCAVVDKIFGTANTENLDALKPDDENFGGVNVFYAFIDKTLGTANTKDLDVGKFGDMFGGVNALFSALAFSGIILTLYFQRTELVLQRNEMKNQVKEMRLYRFENTFFSLLRKQHEITASLPTISYGGLTCSYFEEMHRKYCASSNGLIDFHYELYFTHLYFILTFIDKSNTITENKKSHYASILIAQLDEYELFSLSFHIKQDPVNEEIKILIERYSILRNLNKELIKGF